MLALDTFDIPQQVLQIKDYAQKNVVINDSFVNCLLLNTFCLIGGSGCSAEAQPLYTNAPFGIALAHNGNLTNTDELAVSMKQERRHINTNSDSGMPQLD